MPTDAHSPPRRPAVWSAGFRVVAEGSAEEGRFPIAGCPESLPLEGNVAGGVVDARVEVVGGSPRLRDLRVR